MTAAAAVHPCDPGTLLGVCAGGCGRTLHGGTAPGWYGACDDGHPRNTGRGLCGACRGKATQAGRIGDYYRKRDPKPGGPAVDLDDYGTGLDWRVDAACRGADPDLFFADIGPARDLRPLAELAWRYCQPCPVIDRCHQSADRAAGTVGIWGGSYWRLKSAGAAQSVRIPLVPAAPKREAS